MRRGASDLTRAAIGARQNERYAGINASKKIFLSGRILFQRQDKKRIRYKNSSLKNKYNNQTLIDVC